MPLPAALQNRLQPLAEALRREALGPLALALRRQAVPQLSLLEMLQCLDQGRGALLLEQQAGGMGRLGGQAADGVEQPPLTEADHWSARGHGLHRT